MQFKIDKYTFYQDSKNFLIGYDDNCKLFELALTTPLKDIILDEDWKFVLKFVQITNGKEIIDLHPPLRVNTCGEILEGSILPTKTCNCGWLEVISINSNEFAEYVSARDIDGKLYTFYMGK